MVRYFPLPVLFICLSAVSCRFVAPPGADGTIRGRHAVVLMNDGGVSADEYAAIVRDADSIYEELISLTGLQASFTVAITCDRLRNESFNPSDAQHVLGGFIFLTSSFFDSLPEMRRFILRHEMTHLFMDFFFGQTDLLLFSEGIAEYMEHRGYPAGLPHMYEQTGDLLGITYQQYANRREDFERNYYAQDYYDMGRLVVEYWIVTYGLQNFYSVYRNISSFTYPQVLSEYAGKDYRTILAEIDRYVAEKADK